MQPEPIRIELPSIFDIKSVNTWLFAAPEPVLIDCGEKTDQSWEALQKGLEHHGLKVSDLSKVIITHAHLDHMGMANKITQHSDAEIWVSDYAYDWAIHLKTMLDRRSNAFFEAYTPNLGKAELFSSGNSNFGYEKLSPYWDEIPEHRLKRFPMEGQIEFGGQSWDIIYTPGHCVNQTCFYQKDSQYILSADMLLRMTPIPILDPAIEAPYSRTKSLLMQWQSYEKLLQFPIQKAFPGHFEAFEHVHELIENQMTRIRKKKELCLQMIEDGKRDLTSFLHAIYPNRIHPGTFFMVVGFLDILLHEKKIEARMENGQLQYYKAQE